MDALATYIAFLDKDGEDLGLAFQNFHAEQERSYEGRTYLWASFGYTGASVDLQAANVEANLVFAVTDLMLGFARTATDQEWLVVVKTVWLDPDTLQETSDRLREFYSVTGWAHNRSELTFRLGSPLDSQAAEIPARVLSKKIVGNLPPTGSIAFV